MLRPNSQVTNNLIKARELIADENSWCEFEMELEGRSCALGAIERVGLDQFESREVMLLTKAAKELFSEDYSDDPDFDEDEINGAVWVVNDDIGHAAVMRMFDRAIELSLQDGETRE